MPAKIVIHIIVVPVVLPQLGVLGVLGGRVPVVLRELLKFIILLVDLVVGLALLGWFIFLRGGAGRRRVDVASSIAWARARQFSRRFKPLVSSRPSWPRRPWACRSWCFLLRLAASGLGLFLT